MKKQRQENMIPVGRISVAQRNASAETFNGKANDTIHGRVDKQAHNRRVGPDLPLITSDLTAPQRQVRTWPTPVIPAKAGIQRQPAAASHSCLFRHSRARGNPAHLAAAGNRFSPLSIINYPLSIRPAFTLVELLVVIVIIALIAGITLPAISNMKSSMAQSGAVNTVATAINASRSLAVKLNGKFSLQGARYSGCAALFTPQGTVRFVENDGFARWRANTNIFLEQIYLGKNYESDPTYVPYSADQINGYKDIPGIDNVKIPNDAGVVGIYYENGNPVYLAPPFAVHFTGDGQLQTSYVIPYGSTNPYDGWGFVYYDSEGDHFKSDTALSMTYKLTSIRPSNYDYTLWSSVSAVSAHTTPPLREDNNQLKLPFDRIEAVVGVIVYKKSDFKAAGFEPTDLDGNTPLATQWLAKHGQPVLVSRSTGTILRGRVTTKENQ